MSTHSMNIFCNTIKDQNSKKGIWITDISDHFPIFFITKTNLGRDLTTDPIIEKRSINEKGLIMFEKEIKTVEFNKISTLTDTDLAFELFQKELGKAFVKCFPLKKSTWSYTNNLEWLNPSLKLAIKQTKFLYKESVKTKTKANFNRYKKYKHCLRKILKKEERAHYKAKIELYKFDLKKSWGVLKTIINKNRVETKAQSKFIANNREITDKTEISNLFNEFFTNVGSTLDKKIPISSVNPISFIKGNYEVKLTLKDCNKDEIGKIIKG